jgi:hypothetical protein
MAHDVTPRRNLFRCMHTAELLGQFASKTTYMTFLATFTFSSSGTTTAPELETFDHSPSCDCNCGQLAGGRRPQYPVHAVHVVISTCVVAYSMWGGDRMCMQLRSRGVWLLT